VLPVPSSPRPRRATFAHKGARERGNRSLVKKRGDPFTIVKKRGTDPFIKSAGLINIKGVERDGLLKVKSCRWLTDDNNNTKPVRRPI
jgi:hypothetical protein